MNTVIVEKEYRERKIRASFTALDSGCLVSVTGGDSSHIGAVTIIAADCPMQTLSYPSHKEGLVSEAWAEKIFHDRHCPVTVAAGIHYDQLGSDGIRDVVALTDQMLEELLQRSNP